MPTQDKHPSHIRSAGQINVQVCQLAKAQQLTITQQLPHTSLHQLTNLPPHQLTNSKTYQLTTPPTHQLKTLNCCFLFYNTALIFTPF